MTQRSYYQFLVRTAESYSICKRPLSLQLFPFQPLHSSPLYKPPIISGTASPLLIATRTGLASISAPYLHIRASPFSYHCLPT